MHLRSIFFLLLEEKGKRERREGIKKKFIFTSETWKQEVTGFHRKAFWSVHCHLDGLQCCHTFSNTTMPLLPPPMPTPLIPPLSYDHPDHKLSLLIALLLYHFCMATYQKLLHAFLRLRKNVKTLLLSLIKSTSNKALTNTVFLYNDGHSSWFFVSITIWSMRNIRKDLWNVLFMWEVIESVVYNWIIFL